MSKRKVQFEDDDCSQGTSDGPSKKRNSLDSDSDDEREDTSKYTFLDENEFDGEEEGIARLEDDVKFTPFNLNEELEEGHFDKDGTYIFSKKEEIRDWWLDNIDQSQIANVDAIKKRESSDEEDEESDIDLAKLYEDIIAFLNPNETVSKAMQRLGKSSKRTVNKGKRDEQSTKSDNSDREKLMTLITLADRILQCGDTDIYEKTYDQLKYNASISSSSAPSESKP
ncbi:CD2 antigen cytoplasmic tail-binding protein 2-like protein [Dinothrombium tinctorium]|uniref:CD2 antigen cytoplasmic tail-binding protein 2-like protein n=1 Tax=Dinothrombium tinctorium TaxID=1965070 RepID=A0A443RKZ5_9ACAR|nr:CD2 antigen cytoplasmic tail-binding protein 2-like protein [Dinothrombium tinctorium]